MSPKFFILSVLLMSASSLAGAKEMPIETLERISVAKGYVMAIESADPVLVAQKGVVKDLKVTKVTQLSDTSTRWA